MEYTGKSPIMQKYHYNKHNTTYIHIYLYRFITIPKINKNTLSKQLRVLRNLLHVGVTTRLTKQHFLRGLRILVSYSIDPSLNLRARCSWTKLLRTVSPLVLQAATIEANSDLASTRLAKMVLSTNLIVRFSSGWRWIGRSSRLISSKVFFKISSSLAFKRTGTLLAFLRFLTVFIVLPHC